MQSETGDMPSDWVETTESEMDEIKKFGRNQLSERSLLDWRKTKALKDEEVELWRKQSVSLVLASYVGQMEGLRGRLGSEKNDEE